MFSIRVALKNGLFRTRPVHFVDSQYCLKFFFISVVFDLSFSGCSSFPWSINTNLLCKL
ncbi:hypothetical protein NC651_025789 [Populus alba x Populus x berolinensis]|uniref:Uncharacterized protein n=1 Tax=Populus alba x Populus x berolinensis TaxID=444605 RepID=A0AAD6ME23_9ROSI|nr:hypothetical protein NC651_025789 [Populus alba x Populus x berolinensis]KAJ6983695.1 hypothetical protein NC653_026493 [Populus alba x Populus x berolinensis]